LRRRKRRLVATQDKTWIISLSTQAGISDDLICSPSSKPKLSSVIPSFVSLHSQYHSSHSPFWQIYQAMVSVDGATSNIFLSLPVEVARITQVRVYQCEIVEHFGLQLPGFPIFGRWPLFLRIETLQRETLTTWMTHALLIWWNSWKFKASRTSADLSSPTAYEKTLQLESFSEQPFRKWRCPGQSRHDGS
jgi:hypothetical protein